MGTLSVDKLVKTSAGAAEFILPATDGTAGQSMITDGSGQLSLGDITVPVNAVTTTKIIDNAVDGSKIAMGSDVAGDVLYYNGTDYVRLGAGTANQTLQMNAGATAPAWVTVAAAGTNTPAWKIGISTNQSIADVTTTKVALADVKFDTGFTWDAVNYKGIPGTAGTYLIGCFADHDPSTSSNSSYTYLYVNGAEVAYWGNTMEPNSHFNRLTPGGSTMVTLGATDYVEMFVYTDFVSGSSVLQRSSATICATYMYGMKVIGA